MSTRQTLIAIGEVAREFGVSTQTIRNWTKEGYLSEVRTIGGHRRYCRKEIDKCLGKAEEKTTILYSRVSSADQKQDLERQAAELQKYAKQKK